MKPGGHIEIKIATWNMNQRTSLESWDYIIDEMDADIVLLQECKIPEGIDKRCNIIHAGETKETPWYDQKDWCSAVVTKDYPISEIKDERFINSHNGAVVAGEVETPDFEVSAISIYGIHDKLGYCSTTMHRIVSDITPLIHHSGKQGKFIIGGDYNVSRQWDDCHSDQSHGLVFDRLKDLGLVNCTEEYYRGHKKTNRRDNAMKPYQLDYIHVSASLVTRRCFSCDVLETNKVKRLSDHNPVFVKIKI